MKQINTLMPPTKNFVYTVMLNFYVKPLYKLFYKNIQVNGINNIPKGEPVIMALNHQNAAMDALAVACNINRKAIFFARGDIFANPLIARILYFLGIYPVYRMREGIRNVEKNTESFELATKILKNNGLICLMPEGGHEAGRNLRPLQKGICRIAFEAQKNMEAGKNIYIVPVGINYSNYEHAGSQITVNFGKAIHVNNYMDLPINNAYHVLKTDLTIALKREMIHIENNAYYNSLYSLMKLYAPRLKNIMKTMQVENTSSFAVEKMYSDLFPQLVKQNESFFATLNELNTVYNKTLDDTGLTDTDLVQAQEPISKLLLKSLLALLLMPVALYGFVNNLMCILILFFTLKKFTDKQFYSTIRFVMGSILFPIVYVLQAFIMSNFLPNIWLGLAYFISLPLSAMFMYWYKGFYGRLPIVLTIKMLWGKENNGLSTLNKLRNQIIHYTDEFIIKNSKAQATKG